MMRDVIADTKYCFKYAFDTETGVYVRTGILDDKGRDTGKDPFQASFPHLIDVGIMGHCIHGRTGLCAKAGVGCYESGLREKPISLPLADEETRISTNSLRRFCRFAGKISWCRILPRPAME